MVIMVKYAESRTLGNFYFWILQPGKKFFLGLFYILNMGFVGGNFEREFF